MKPETRNQKPEGAGAAWLRVALFFWFLVSGFWFVPAFAANTLVLLPIDNLAGSEAAGMDVLTTMRTAIEAKGWTVAPADKVDAVLEETRTRYLDSLDASVRAKLVEATGAQGIVSATLFTYAEGKNPVVAVAARMVRADGSPAWGDVAAVASVDTERKFGFGRDTEVGKIAARTIEQLLREFPADIETRNQKPETRTSSRRAPSGFWFLVSGFPPSYVALDPRSPHRVCVLPFENKSRTAEAARIVSDILTIRLASASGFEVVEPAVLRAAALKTRVGSLKSPASKDLQRLASAVGTPLFLRGTIYEYTENGGGTPKIDVELMLVDVEAGRVLWSAQDVRRGTDSIGLLMRGAVSNAVTLTDRVVTEMIDATRRQDEAQSTRSERAAALRRRLAQQR